MVTGNYSLDGVACYLYPTPALGLTPLYRLGRKQPKDQLYTTSLDELYHALTQFNYEAQGVAGHVLGTQFPGAVPLYKLSKPA
jgi:hypothetical protein